MRNFIIKTIFFTIILISVTACNGNLFLSDESNDFKNDLETDIAYITDNCEQVIINLKERADADTLTVFEKYQYVTSELACSGFAISRALSAIISTSGDTEPLDMMYRLIGVNQYTTTNINNLFTTYDNIEKQCLNRIDDKLLVVCVLSATAVNTISVTKTVMEILTISKLIADFKIIQDILYPDIGTVIQDTIDIYPLLSFDDLRFEQRLITSSEFIRDNRAEMQSILGLKDNAALFEIFDDLTEDFLDVPNYRAQGLGIMVLELFKIPV